MEGFYEASRRVLAGENYIQVARDLLNAKREIGICAFSEIKDNELMWAHYASNYAGICIAYRPQRLIDGLPGNVHLVRLAYGTLPPEISYAEAVDLPRAARKILSHKKVSWVYEREWRVLGSPGRLTIHSKGCVGEVYLGARVKPEHKDRILGTLAYTSVRIYEMRVAKYSHEWIELKKLKGSPQNSSQNDV
jgi:hypothetical protein